MTTRLRSVRPRRNATELEGQPWTGGGSATSPYGVPVPVAEAPQVKEDKGFVAKVKAFFSKLRKKKR